MSLLSLLLVVFLILMNEIYMMVVVEVVELMSNLDSLSYLPCRMHSNDVIKYFSHVFGWNNEFEMMMMMSPSYLDNNN